MVDKDTTIRILGYAKNGFLQNGEGVKFSVSMGKNLL